MYTTRVTVQQYRTDTRSIRVLALYEELYEELEAENRQNAEKPEARNLGLFKDLRFGRR